MEIWKKLWVGVFSEHSVVTRKPDWPNKIDTLIIMKVMQSGRETARRLIIFRRTSTPAILFWAYTPTPGHLILDVLVNFLAYNTPVRPLTEAPM